jgi:hypothetical protein
LEVLLSRLTSPASATATDGATVSFSSSSDDETIDEVGPDTSKKWERDEDEAKSRLRYRRRPAIAISLLSSFDEVATDGDVCTIDHAPMEWLATMSMILIGTVDDSRYIDT